MMVHRKVMMNTLIKLIRAKAGYLAITTIIGIAELKGATIVGTVVDTGGNPSTTNITFSPLSTPLLSSDRVIYSTVKSVNTDIYGKFSVQLEPGNYKATIGTNIKDSFVISVPADNSTNDWSVLISGGLTYSFPFSPIYEERRLRGVAGGYAALNQNGYVPLNQLGGGAAGSNCFLRGNNYWSAIIPQDIGSGLISDEEFNALDGVQSPIQPQLNQRVIQLNGFATNLFIEKPNISGNFRLNPSEKPTSPVDGDGWYDSNQRSLMVFQSGLVQSVETAIFVSTNTTTCTNTTSETAIIPSGIGSLILPSGFLTTGKTISIKMRGIYSSPPISSTITLKFKIGDSVLTTPTISYTTGQANKYIYFDYQLTCIDTGTNGAYTSSGVFGSQTFTCAFSSTTNPQNRVISIDTTKDNEIVVTATHSRSDASLTVNQLIIQKSF